MGPLVIVVGSTTAPYLIDGSRELRWLTNAEEMAASADVKFFLALETYQYADSADVEPLIDAVESLDGNWWMFSIEDDATELTSFNRLIRITTGRNLITEYAVRAGASHILFLDADLIVPGDSILKLLEMDWPIVGGDVPAYCLSGPWMQKQPFPVQRHWNTAGFLLVAREVFTQIRWRHDPDRNLTDDPCYAEDAKRLGYETLVRKDLVGIHEGLVPVEQRGLDRRIP